MSHERREHTPTTRIEFENSRGLNLIGDFYSAASDTVVVMSHGLGSSRSESGQFSRVAEALNGVGYNVFRFDYSGNGESDDCIITPQNEIDDLRSAIKFCEAKGLTNVALVAYSFGSYIAMSEAGEFKSVVLWSPVIAPIQDPEDFYLTSFPENNPRNREMLAEDCYVERRKIERASFKVQIGREVFDEWRTIDQGKLLSGVKVPVLIIHGSEDERVPVEGSREAVKFLPAGSVLREVEGVGHTFGGDTAALLEPTVSWIKEHAPVK
jgi:pimeloyl-ACP methyl ester carboxylesterase